MLYREIIAVCSQIHTKDTNALSVKPDQQWLFDFMCPLIRSRCIIDLLSESKAPSKFLPVNVHVMRMLVMCMFC